MRRRAGKLLPAIVMPGSAGRDGPRNREDALRVADVEVLDHAAIDRDDALASGLGLLEGRDDDLGMLDLVVRGCEGRVGRSDLVRVDQSLAVESEVATLLSLCEESFLVLHVVVDAVEDDLAGSTST